MYKKCPTCLTELLDNDPAFDIQAISTYVDNHGGWAAFESGNYGIANTFTLNNSKVANVVEKKISYDAGDVDVEGFYGESALPQGSRFTTYVVIEVGEAFFKKTGTGDSYGSVSRDGDFARVFPKIVERYVFE